METGRYNFKLYQGATWTRTFTLLQGNEPLLVDGWTAGMKIRRRNPDGETLFTLTTENGGITLENNQVHVRIEAESSTEVVVTGRPKYDKLVYDLELYSGDDTYRLLEGFIDYEPEVTR